MKDSEAILSSTLSLYVQYLPFSVSIGDDQGLQWIVTSFPAGLKKEKH